MVLLDSARSAEPPQSSGSSAAIALMTVPDAFRVATPFGSASNVGSASAQPSGSVRVCIRSKSAASADGLVVQCRNSLVPRGLGRLAAGHRLAGVREDVVGDLEGLVGVEAEDLLGGRDLVVAERGAVRLAGVLRVGAGHAMIVRSTMKLGRSVTASAFWIASYSAGTSSRYSVSSWVQSTVCTCQP